MQQREVRSSAAPLPAPSDVHRGCGGRRLRALGRISCKTTSRRPSFWTQSPPRSRRRIVGLCFSRRARPRNPRLSCMRIVPRHSCVGDGAVFSRWILTCGPGVPTVSSGREILRWRWARRWLPAAASYCSAISIPARRYGSCRPNVSPCRSRWPHQWARLVADPAWNEVDLSSLHYVGERLPTRNHPTVKSDWQEPDGRVREHGDLHPGDRAPERHACGFRRGQPWRATAGQYDPHHRSHVGSGVAAETRPARSPSRVPL